jgi:hypothetical protein
MVVLHIHICTPHRLGGQRTGVIRCLGASSCHWRLEEQSAPPMRMGSVSVDATRTGTQESRRHCYVKAHGSRGPSAALRWECSQSC